MARSSVSKDRHNRRATHRDDRIHYRRSFSSSNSSETRNNQRHKRSKVTYSRSKRRSSYQSNSSYDRRSPSINNYRRKDIKSPSRHKHVSRPSKRTSSPLPSNEVTTNNHKEEKYHSYTDKNKRSHHDKEFINKNRQEGLDKLKSFQNVSKFENQTNKFTSKISEQSESELSEEEIMMKFMGIDGFNSSKNKDHSQSDLSGINKKTKRKYRQYMNRKGGFNRPLSPAF